MRITVTVTSEPMEATASPSPQSCPSCSKTSTVQVKTRWTLYRMWGLPIRAREVSTEWQCPACRKSVRGNQPVPGAPPFIHRMGGAIIVAVMLSGCAIGAYFLFAPTLSIRSKYAAEQNALEPVRARARQVAANAAQARAACFAALDASTKAALPGGVMAAKDSRPGTKLDLEALRKLPRLVATEHRDKLHSSVPAACRTDHGLDSHEIEHVDPGTFILDTPETAARKVDAYEARLADLTPKEFFAVEVEPYGQACKIGAALIGPGGVVAVGHEVVAKLSATCEPDVTFGILSAWTGKKK